MTIMTNQTIDALCEQVERHVEIVDGPTGFTTPCWLWKGSQNKGAPRIDHQGAKYSSRRIAWLIICGEETEDSLYVACGNPLCVRHLTKKVPPRTRN